MDSQSLPMVNTPLEAQALVNAIVDDDRIATLVSDFGPGMGGLPRLITYLQEIGPHLRGIEETQADRILAAWTSTSGQPVTTRPRVSDPSLAVDWLTSYAAGRWDFRCGQERDFIPTSRELLPDSTATAVYTLADSWDMRTPRMANGDFDAVIVLGGLVRANLNRPQSAAALLSSGRITTPLVVGLAGDRDASPQEAALARQLGAPDDTELAALTFGMGSAFGVAPDQWIPVADGSGGNGLRAVGPDGLELLVVSAPVVAPGKRAGAAAAFEWFARSSGLVTDASRILSITTPIYWIQNHIDLLERLAKVGSAAQLVTAGGGIDVVPDPLRQTYLSQHYLQEIKSAIDALPRLIDWSGSVHQP